MAIEDADIILSVKDAVQSILEDADEWTEPFTVYGAKSYREGALGAEPDRPYAFLIAAREPIEIRWLPVILVDGDVSGIGFQMGSTSRIAEMRIHVIARSQGEATRLTGKIAVSPSLDNLALYDHAAGDETPDAYTLAENGWKVTSIPVPQKWSLEGTIKHWAVMENSYIVP